MSIRSCISLLLVVLLPALLPAADDLSREFADPPLAARTRAYWWWLNGNVTKEAITKDLEWMKHSGMGGGLIADGGGAAGPVPTGPTFQSPAWRELFVHAVHEADRLGLRLSVVPQSGWNLGGPSVTPEQATKHITWSTLQVQGPASFAARLPMPPERRNFYRDTFVLAYRCKDEDARRIVVPEVTASSNVLATRLETILSDGHDTFWVGGGRQPGEGPSPERPEWLQFTFRDPLPLGGAVILGRPGYSPRQCQWQTSLDGKQFQTVAKFTVDNGRETTIHFPAVKVPTHRLLILDAYDSKNPDAPRNCQIVRLTLLDAQGQKMFTGKRAGPIRDLASKALFHELGGSPKDCSYLLDDVPATAGEEDVAAGDVLDLSEHLAPDGTLRWDVPQGNWQIFRFGYTNSGARVSTASGVWKGMVLDYLNSEALRAYWQQVVEPMLADLGPLAGKTLEAFETDSWEAGGLNWTARMPEEFRRRRGYDLKPWLPVIAGYIVENRDASNRFLADLRKTVADCMAENHYGVMAELAARHGMFIHCEAAGPHLGPFDGLKNLGRCGAPMSEFWVPSPHRPTEAGRFFVKVASSAAHIYGKRIVCAESFTSVGPHWEESLWKDIKSSFDHEACAGLNLAYCCPSVCSPAEMGVPGQEMFAGTHFNPQITWARQAHALVAYLNRCQALLQRGQFVADVCYYQGDHVPNIVERKQADPAKVLPQFDYDVVNEEVLLTRMVACDGRIVLPDGMSYRLMVLPDRKTISLAALKKIEQLVLGGAVVLGPRPNRTASLQDYPACDAELQRIAEELWGKSRVIEGKPAKDVLAALGVAADFESPADANLDYIHRRDGQSEIYFISNPQDKAVQAPCRFRTSGKQPELWDAVTGDTRPARAFRQADGRTTVPLELPPYGSLFVVFRTQIAENASGPAASNFPATTTIQTLTGPWTIEFDPKWGGPSSVQFDALVDWTTRGEDGIKFYSGTATYRKTFDRPTTTGRLLLDFGTVKELAEVRLNGKNLGVVWCPPWRVDITEAVKATDNHLEIDVINLWPNRLIGDAALPPEKRYAKTTVSKFSKPPIHGSQWKLLPSGLLGPVTLQAEK